MNVALGLFSQKGHLGMRIGFAQGFQTILR
jgi:hypothetical protein